MRHDDASNVLGAATAATPPAGAAREGSPFDFPAIAARLARPAAHRQVFAAAKVSDGDVLHYMVNSLNAYETDYGEGPGSLHVAAVCYSAAVMMLLDDAAWTKYQIASLLKHRGDPATTTDAKNPFDASLAALVARGASFFACNNALRGTANGIVQYATSTEPVGVILADLQRHLVPGALLVPAGVAAVNQAQEAKFTLFNAS
jgi:intracellular sulfur oxidation DsrE/DsrF family protein